jgi:hypothetical protein
MIQRQYLGSSRNQLTPCLAHARAEHGAGLLITKWKQLQSFRTSRMMLLQPSNQYSGSVAWKTLHNLVNFQNPKSIL